MIRKIKIGFVSKRNEIIDQWIVFNRDFLCIITEINVCKLLVMSSPGSGRSVMVGLGGAGRGPGPHITGGPQVSSHQPEPLIGQYVDMFNA